MNIMKVVVRRIDEALHWCIRGPGLESRSSLIGKKTSLTLHSNFTAKKQFDVPVSTKL